MITKLQGWCINLFDLRFRPYFVAVKRRTIIFNIIKNCVKKVVILPERRKALLLLVTHFSWMQLLFMEHLVFWFLKVVCLLFFLLNEFALGINFYFVNDLPHWVFIWSFCHNWHQVYVSAIVLLWFCQAF